ncbi:MAG TPA: amylo-alpha-1,6-glucosidase [Anaerohalosphaeraceae bacterium]|jgi:predicted glycogen debranching enzyme|nr:amylo-alpha-1,6-glucosidase [Anaerohalosphaeraceae bacterium]HRT49185.1 amylo-alpha-1,6-glucosidase [Anaerohalosphaeraceae bacterium]HRT85276.1 amylo-alpha-1,6-glucosidase [Anaerohalosphaeraceae bacterium]
MLASRDQGQGISVQLQKARPDALLEREWLLTNSRGGFSSGTLGGCNTRRYHGLLIGSLNPPANRVVGLSCYREVLRIDGVEVDLGNFEFAGRLALNGLRYAVSFRRDTGVHFDYDFGIMEMTKSIYLLPELDTTAVVYHFSNVCQKCEFEVRPFAAMRDFHALQKSWTPLVSEWRDDGLAIRSSAQDAGELFLLSDHMWFKNDPQWWYNFFYRKDKQRGQDCTEDLWSPGVFTCHIESMLTVVLWAAFGPQNEAHLNLDVDLDIAIESLSIRDREILGEEKIRDPMTEALYRSAAQFVVERRIRGKDSWTILAGYPWFLDWGRDTFIALPGLLLCTGRLKEAAAVLTTFAAAEDQGMIPNRFDDYGGEPHYNSIDASLWFIHSAFEYLYAGGDRELFSKKVLPAIRRIVAAYEKGTRFGIHADTDGLITGGDENTQLTWMDAKCGGIAFTPRYGKAVEVNALWYDALCNLADYYQSTDEVEAEVFRQWANRVGKRFAELFWNERAGCLFDCVFPDGRSDSAVRPNQIYAVALRHCALSEAQQRQVVAVVKRDLWTPYGLRSLASTDPGYIGRYQGDQMQRDRAYHNGTVWSHLMGPFIDAFLRVNGNDRATRVEAMEMLEPLLDHFMNSGCVQSVSEIFDGDAPHTPRGCFAQAWSVAALLRAYTLVSR